MADGKEERCTKGRADNPVYVSPLTILGDLFLSELASCTRVATILPYSSLLRKPQIVLLVVVLQNQLYRWPQADP